MGDKTKGMPLNEKEQRILDAAIKIFSEKGFSASTTSEIAKTAGIAEGTIFRYFKTKKDILRRLLIEVIKSVSDKFVMEPIEKILAGAQDKDERQILKELILDRLSLVDRVYPIARVLLVEAIYHEDIREAIYDNIISRARKLFHTFFNKMAEMGKFRNIDPDILLRSFIGNMFAFIVQKKLFPEKFLLDVSLEEELDIVIDIMLNGISPSQSK